MYRLWSKKTLISIGHDVSEVNDVIIFSLNDVTGVKHTDHLVVTLLHQPSAAVRVATVQPPYAHVKSCNDR